MKGKSYSVEDLRAYLLGAASAADVERIDELSVTDGEFADLIGAVEKDLIDSYVRRELDGDELRRFAEAYLGSAAGLEKVRFARVFAEYADARARGISEEKRASFFSRLTGMWSVPTLTAAAALIAVAAMLGWLAVRDRGGVEVVTEINNNAGPGRSPSPVDVVPGPTVSATARSASPQPSPTQVRPSPTREIEIPTRPVVASIILRPPLRGAGVSEVRIPSGAERVAARVELESEDLASYSAEVVDAGGAVVWRSGRLRAAGASLNLNLPARILPPALYTVRVSGRSGSGAVEIIGDYPFRVVQ